MDQTSVAVYAGVIAAPSVAMVLRKITGWSYWAVVPLGAMGGFVVVTLAVYLLIGSIGKRAGRKKSN